MDDRSYYLGVNDCSECRNLKADGMIWLHPLNCRNGIIEGQSKGIEQIVMPDIWDNAGRIRKAAAYIEHVADKLLEELAHQLNLIHHTDYSAGAWQNVLAPWLHYYTASMYYKYRQLMEVYNLSMDVYLYSFGNAYRTPQDMPDFAGMIEEEQYNYQQYLTLAQQLGFRILNKGGTVQDQGEQKAQKHNGRQSMQRPSKGAMAGCELLLYQVFAPDKYCRALEALSRGRIRNMCSPKNNNLGEFNYSGELRRRIKLEDKGDDRFADLIRKVIFRDIPLYYVEGFRQILGMSREYIPYYPKTLITSVAMYYDEMLKFMLMDKQPRLCCQQHGGDYAVYPYAGIREFKLCDIFYSAGWKSNRIPYCEIRPMPMLKLLNNRNSQKQKSRRGKEMILYTNYIYPMYPFRFSYEQEIRAKQLFAAEEKFLDNLDKDIFTKMEFRLYQYDYGWRWRETLLDRYPLLRINNRKSFPEQLSRASLLIANAMGTTYLEALALNKPCIVYFTTHKVSHCKGSERYLDLLREAGILHDSPEAAAKLINRINGHIEEWWMEPARQRAVKLYCRKYGYAPKYSWLLWAMEIARLLWEGKRVKK